MERHPDGHGRAMAMSAASSMANSPVGSPPPANEMLRPWAGSLVLSVLQHCEAGDTSLLASLVAQGWDPNRPSLAVGEGETIVMHAIVIACIEGACSSSQGGVVGRAYPPTHQVAIGLVLVIWSFVLGACNTCLCVFWHVSSCTWLVSRASLQSRLLHHGMFYRAFQGARMRLICSCLPAPTFP